MHIKLTKEFNLILELKSKQNKRPSGDAIINKEASVASSRTNTISDVLSCPNCKKGTVIKGNTAYGCSEFKNGCEFRVSFQDIRNKAQGKALTKELVTAILNSC